MNCTIQKLHVSFREECKIIAQILCVCVCMCAYESLIHKVLTILFIIIINLIIQELLDLNYKNCLFNHYSFSIKMWFLSYLNFFRDSALCKTTWEKCKERIYG